MWTERNNPEFGKAGENEPARHLSMVSGDFIGTGGVMDSEGNNIGKIEQAALDLTKGCIAYVLFSVTGTMQYDTKLLAVPWKVFSFDQASGMFKLNIPRAKLENAPAYDEDNFPAQASDRWLTAIYSYYGFQPYWM